MRGWFVVRDGFGSATLRRRGIAWAVALGAVAGVWLAGSPAQAEASTVTGGSAVISVDRNLVNSMSNRGVRMRAARPGNLRRNRLKLPFASGDFLVDTNDPAPLEPLAIEGIGGNGVLRGGLRLIRRNKARGANRSVTIRNLRVNLDQRRVTAKVGRRNILLFTINMSWATPAGVTAERPRLLSAPLRLTPAGARHLNRGLGRRVFKPKRGFGQLTAAPLLAGG